MQTNLTQEARSKGNAAFLQKIKEDPSWWAEHKKKMAEGKRKRDEKVRKALLALEPENEDNQSQTLDKENQESTLES
jgi:hypothetical protein